MSKNAGSQIHFKDRGRQPAVLSHHTHAERNARDLLESDRRLCAFLEEHVLPVAVQTQALVLLHVDCCHMAWAFDRLCIDYAKTMASGKLPFTVLHFCAATHVLYDL